MAQRSTLFVLFLLVVACIVTGGRLAAENWPGWRGPRGDGTVRDTKAPVSWDGETGRNIQWKVEVPGSGHSSPIVWGNRVFLVSCLEETQERVLQCFDCQNGNTVWQKTVVKSVLETRHRLNSYASGTPATDGKLVYVTFLVTDGRMVPALNVGKQRPTTTGDMVVAACDFDGNLQWIVRPGVFTSVHGYCSSPVIFRHLLIINGDHDGDSYVVALDRSSGETVWKIPREHKTRSYCTPIIRDVAGKTQMVFTGSKRIVSLDPLTGKKHWLIEGPTEQFVSSMVFDGRKFYMTAGFPTHHVMGIRPDGQGNVTDSHVSWHSKEAKCYVPSPVLVGRNLFVADDRGTANCFDTETGQRIWRDRLGVHYSASLISANGMAYFIADDGVTKLVKPETDFEVVHENKLGEYTFASPAVSNGQLFIRGEQHLFAIGAPAVAQNPDQRESLISSKSSVSR